jgi:hypothetical protein|tara:strand:+ start:1781 stop:2158 length:378 start_codon:yes stop_codon:yes gene_type:complete
MKTNQHWTAEELLSACGIARDFEYNKNIYALIGRELERPESSVKAAVARVRNGESSFQYNKKDPRFLEFLKEGATVIENPSKKKEPETIKIPFSTDESKPSPRPEVVVKRGFSIKLCWGLIEITR